MTTVAIGLLLLLLAILLLRHKETPWPLGPEGFQSIGNPYNAPSPALYQALTFRLGKQRLVDDVENWAELRMS